MFYDVDNLYGPRIRGVGAHFASETELMTKKTLMTDTAKGMRDGAKPLPESCSTMLITYMAKELEP